MDIRKVYAYALQLVQYGIVYAWLDGYVHPGLGYLAVEYHLGGYGRRQSHGPGH